jgi:hypothetical protein
MSEMQGNWKIHGVIAEEQAEDNSSVSSTPGAQEATEYKPIYATDSRDEAATIIREGGFDLNGRWHVGVWAEDDDGNIIGAKPSDAPVASTKTGGNKKKSDF